MSEDMEIMTKGYKPAQIRPFSIMTAWGTIFYFGMKFYRAHHEALAVAIGTIKGLIYLYAAIGIIAWICAWCFGMVNL